MISIKKYLDLDPNELNKYREAGPDELLALTLNSYRSALTAMGSCGVQACPALGHDLQQGLMGLVERLSNKVTPPVVKETEERIEEQLQQWGGRTAEYFHERAADVKEILLVLAHAAESVAERDQKYTSQFGEFTKRLRTMANLEDLPQIRSALMRGAKELKATVDNMEQDSHESVAALRTQVTTYQVKLEEAEQRASRDTMTGLDNRNAVETKTEHRIAENRPFCVVMLDLNGFKQVNDTHGHLAGDDLLKQFATELRSASRSTDAVGRWGGDEFVIVLDCNLGDARSHMERLRRWVVGEYSVQLGTDVAKVNLDAAIGLVEWQPGETMKEVLGRADAAMYQQKAVAHEQPPPTQTGRNNETRATP
ncbi:MAG: GGDEF domain-containing protein [Terriglobia bacterium]